MTWRKASSILRSPIQIVRTRTRSSPTIRARSIGVTRAWRTRDVSGLNRSRRQPRTGASRGCRRVRHVPSPIPSNVSAHGHRVRSATSPMLMLLSSWTCRTAYLPRPRRPVEQPGGRPQSPTPRRFTAGASGRRRRDVFSKCRVAIGRDEDRLPHPYRCRLSPLPCGFLRDQEAVLSRVAGRQAPRNGPSASSAGKQAPCPYALFGT
jgi:hypothetical protein